MAALASLELHCTPLDSVVDKAANYSLVVDAHHPGPQHQSQNYGIDLRCLYEEKPLHDPLPQLEKIIDMVLSAARNTDSDSTGSEASARLCPEPLKVS